MLRLILLFGLCAPCLLAGTLLDLTGDADETAAAAEGETLILRYATDAAVAKTVTHFDAGTPHWIVSIDADKRVLRVQPLTDHGPQAQPRYTEQGAATERPLSDWPSHYAVNLLPLSELAVMPTASADLCRLALWFHSRGDGASAGNRTLAALHEANAAARPAIEAWLREHQFDNAKGKFELVAVWDAEFKRTRNHLMPASRAKEYRTTRDKQADESREQLHKDYANTARPMTLEVLRNRAGQWLEDWPDTAAFKKHESAVRKLRDAIAADITVATAAFDKGEQSAKAARLEKNKAQAAKHWLAAAESHDAARKLDPGNAAYLAAAAEAWLAYGDPEFKGDQWICTRENGIKKALPLYEQLAKLSPDVKGYQQNADLCRRILGK
jgi:hypothetical protein